MRVVFVDSNLFLRFFTADDAGQHARASALFQNAAAGKVALVTGPPVFFEIAWTLGSAYHQPNEKTLDVLSAIAAAPGLALLDRDLVEETISLARQSGAEYADAYIAASARRARADEIATFNRKHFGRLAVSLAVL